MDKKLRLIHGGISLISGLLLTTNMAFASVVDLAGDEFSISTATIPNGMSMPIELYGPGQESANLANFSYSPSDSTDNFAPTPVPAPAAAWLFGSGLIGLLGLGRKRKKR